MNKLEEATKLALKLERAHDLGTKIGRKVQSAGWIKEAEISTVRARIAKDQERLSKLKEERDAMPSVARWSARLAAAYKFERELEAILKSLAADLVDAKAFFPSGKKSQELTKRVTLKSQLPTAPEILDLKRFLWVALDNYALDLITTKVEVGLDGALAAKWRAQQPEGFDTGLGPPKPKILNIKVKEGKDE